ncbi:MAG: hypothetical protein ACYC5H_10200 [Methylovirgula sp.]
MFFLIRCVFWLTVVFSTIFNSNQGSTVSPHRAEAVRQSVALTTQAESDASANRLSRAAQDWVTAALESFWSRATGGCAGTPTECVTLAARLSDFARHHSFDAQDTPPAVQGSFQTAQADVSPAASIGEVPLPPPRPPHLGLLEKPANSGLARDRRVTDGHAEAR